MFEASKDLMVTFQDKPKVWPLPPLTELLYGPNLVAGGSGGSSWRAPFRTKRPLFPIYNVLAMTASTGGANQPFSIPATGVGKAGRPNPTTNVESGSSTDGSESAKSATATAKEQAADPDDLHLLVVEHGDAIYRLALSVVRDPSLAEDVAQETLVKAWLALPSFRGDASLRSWLLRITHNTAVSTLRRRRAVVLDPHDLPEEQTRVERSVEARVQGEVVMDQFVEALDTLDDLSRSIVVLRELEGLSYEEISDVLNVPMPTVKTRLLRARRRLGNALREWA